MNAEGSKIPLTRGPARFCLAGVIGLALLNEAPAQRVRVSPSAGRRMATQHSRPSNYGSLHSSSVRSTQYQGTVGNTRHIQTSDGGRATVTVGRSGQVAVSGRTADGESYRTTGGVGTVAPARTAPARYAGSPFQTSQGTVVTGQTRGGGQAAAIRTTAGASAAVVNTGRGDVVFRDRDGETTVLTDLDDRYRRVTVGGNPYYYHDYRYYWPYSYGGSVYYQEVYAPEGSTVTELPEESAAVTSGGQEYLYYDGVYYVQDGAQYQVAEPPAAPAAPVVPPPEPRDPMELLEAMSAYLAGRTSFSLKTTEFYDAPQADGRMKAQMPQRIFSVRKPDRLAVARRDGFDIRRLWYDGSSAVLADESKKVYSRIDAPGTLPEFLELFRSDYGVTVPLADFLRSDFVETVTPLLTRVDYAGWQEVVGHRCHRLALETADVHARVFIDEDPEAPLLRRVQLIYVNHPTRPEYVATVNEWDLDASLPDGVFRFQAPPGYNEIAMVPVLPGPPMTEDR